jgi:hypothetical protein
MAPNAMIYSVDLWSEEFILQDLKDTYGDAKNYEFKEHPLWETYLMNVWSLQDRNVPVRMKTVEGLHALKDAGIEPDVIYVRLHTHTHTYTPHRCSPPLHTALRIHFIVWRDACFLGPYVIG